MYSENPDTNFLELSCHVAVRRSAADSAAELELTLLQVLLAATNQFTFATHCSVTVITGSITSSGEQTNVTSRVLITTRHGVWVYDCTRKFNQWLRSRWRILANLAVLHFCDVSDGFYMMPSLAP